MTNIFKKTFMYIFFTFLIYVFITNSNLIIKTVNTSTNLFISKLLPTLFPFFILVDILINYDYIRIIINTFKFKYIDIIITSIFSSLPSNAKYINSLLKDNKIDLYSSSIMLSLTFFPSIIFTISYIGSYIGKKESIFILLITYISNLIVYIINYKNLKYIPYKLNKKPIRFTKALKESVIKNAKALMGIYGNIIVFNIIINIISYYFNFSEIILCIINIFLELTTGTKRIIDLNINIYYKYILFSFALSFSSLSVLFQGFSLLEEYKINIKLIIKNKIIISLISLLLSYIVFTFLI